MVLSKKYNNFFQKRYNEALNILLLPFETHIELHLY